MFSSIQIGRLVEDAQRLEIGCAGCRRRVLWPAAEAVARLGASTTFQQARERLVCSACGARYGAEHLISARGCVVDFYAKLRAEGHGVG